MLKEELEDDNSGLEARELEEFGISAIYDERQKRLSQGGLYLSQAHRATAKVLSSKTRLSYNYPIITKHHHEADDMLNILLPAETSIDLIHRLIIP
jgi:hypothetical protein